MPHTLQEYRCASCKKLLFKGVIAESIIEIKCKRCGEVNEIRGKSVNEFVCLVEHCSGRVTVLNK